VEVGSANAADAMTQLTGLAASVIADPDGIICEANIESAPQEKRAWLRERLGKKVCSVVSDAALEKLGAKPDQEDFSPSVPFVACMSAALVVSEAVLSLMEPGRLQVSKFIFDMLQGPHNGVHLCEMAKRTCDCTSRFDVISQWKSQMSHPA
jgi:hypothetical protein